MEIDSQQMEELVRIQAQQTAQTNRQQSTATPGQFESLFSEALNTQSSASHGTLGSIQPARAEQAAMISQMLLNPIEETALSTDPVQNAFNSASGTLDLWDSYAKTIGSSNDSSSLRDAYSILENIGAQVAQLKSDSASLAQQNPGLNSLINELDIMATTERVKFNRGDYA